MIDPKLLFGETKDNFNLRYELALKEGNRRFGSECKHAQVKNGKCVHCLRTVIDTIRE